MTRLLPILALLLIAAAPVEAQPPLGTYREVSRTNYKRFVCSKWQIYTRFGWRPTWVEDRHLQRRYVFFIGTSVTYSTASPKCPPVAVDGAL